MALNSLKFLSWTKPHRPRTLCILEFQYSSSFFFYCLNSKLISTKTLLSFLLKEFDAWRILMFLNKWQKQSYYNFINKISVQVVLQWKYKCLLDLNRDFCISGATFIISISSKNSN